MSLSTGRQELLASWAETVRDAPKGDGYDLTDTGRTARLRERVDDFIADATEARFDAMWNPKTLVDAQLRPAGLVSQRFHNEAAIADFVETVRDADSFDPMWEDWVSGPVLWEFYGRLHADSEPILSNRVGCVLDDLGFGRPTDREEQLAAFEEFREEYEEAIGHVTADTDHAVSIFEEIDGFLAAVDADTL